MNRTDHAQWRKSTAAQRRAMTTRILAENEPLVQRCVANAMQKSQYHLESMREDILQAARVGMMRAIPQWDPERGAWSTCAWWWMRHEIQQVTRHATPISRPKSADLPRKKQDAAAAFLAQFGREPEPDEIGVSQAAMARHEKAQAKFVSMQLYTDTEKTETAERELAAVVEEGPEETLDRIRDLRALKTFFRKLSAAEKKELEAGTNPELGARAKAYVEGRRRVRRAK